MRTESFQEIQEIQKHLILLKRGREGEDVRKSEIFQNTPVPHIIQQKKKKTSDDSENGALLSQFGRRCPPMLYMVCYTYR